MRFLIAKEIANTPAPFVILLFSSFSWSYNRYILLILPPPKKKPPNKVPLAARRAWHTGFSPVTLRPHLSVGLL